MTNADSIRQMTDEEELAERIPVLKGVDGMDKAKILRLCSEIEDIATEIQERTMKDSYFMAQTIINKVLVIAAEISAKPKSNADRIRQMTDEELAEMLDIYDVEEVCAYCIYQGVWACHNRCSAGILEWLTQEEKDETD